jgi:flagellar hook-associated protein 2
MQLLESDQTTVNNESTELQTISGLFNSVQTSIQSLASVTQGSSQSASVSNTSIVQANLTGSALPGAYTIDVTNPGASASAMSIAPVSPQTPVTDPTSQDINSSDTYTLTVGSQTYNISAQNLNALASAINSSGAPVQALVINIGSPSSPDYRLVVQSNTLGDTALQLSVGSTNLLNSLTTGSNATYTVNGQPPAGITTSSSVVTVAPGLNVGIEAGGTATVTVTNNLDNVSNSLSSFVTAYNSAVAELGNNHGQNGAALTGDSIVLSLQQSLNQIADYTGGSGSITSLAQLGVTFTQQGTLSFDPTVLSGLSQTQITDALSFLGNPSTSGFLQFATNTLTGITDPTSGIISSEAQALTTQSQNDQQQINNDQNQINQLQTTLQAQMAASDALIATLQSQNTFLQGLFQYDTSNNPDVATTG